MCGRRRTQQHLTFRACSEALPVRCMWPGSVSRAPTSWRASSLASTPRFRRGAARSATWSRRSTALMNGAAVRAAAGSYELGLGPGLGASDPSKTRTHTYTHTHSHAATHPPLKPRPPPTNASMWPTSHSPASPPSVHSTRLRRLPPCPELPCARCDPPCAAWRRRAARSHQPGRRTRRPGVQRGGAKAWTPRSGGWGAREGGATSQEVEPQ
jgi:hypothetical protein